MKKILIIPIFLVALIVLNGCYNNNSEVLYPELNSLCDTTNVTYNQNIKKIINSYCVSCHGSNYKSSGGGTRLDNYDDVSGNIKNIMGAMKHESGYEAMPKNANKLSDCIIQQFEIWNSQGTPNN